MRDQINRIFILFATYARAKFSHQRHDVKNLLGLILFKIFDDSYFEAVFITPFFKRENKLFLII